MKNLSDHKSAVIKAQKQQIDELMEERDILKRELKSSIATTKLLWDMLQLDTKKGYTDAS